MNIRVGDRVLIKSVESAKNTPSSKVRGYVDEFIIDYNNNGMYSNYTFRRRNLRDCFRLGETYRVGNVGGGGPLPINIGCQVICKDIIEEKII